MFHLTNYILSAKHVKFSITNYHFEITRHVKFCGWDYGGKWVVDSGLDLGALLRAQIAESLKTTIRVREMSLGWF